jgi:hypothetical protein
LIARIILAAAALGAALGAAPALAEPAPPVDFSLTFSSTTPGSATDAALHILYKDPEDSDNPDGKPPALTDVRIAAPPGTVFDGAAVSACPASDAELMLLGRAACPPASDVGDGFASVVTTFTPPTDRFVSDVTLFNYGDGIVELLEFVEGGIRVTDRARFEGKDTMVLHPTVVPGITEREFKFTYRGTLGSPGKPFITTPPDCPPSGAWTARITYTVTTGATYTATGTTPCVATTVSEPAASEPVTANGQGMIRASLTPRRVRAGKRARIRVRLRSSDPRCVAGATVRLAGHRPVRTNRAGRATIAQRFREEGRRTLMASKRGCATGRAALTVLPAM